MSALVRPIIAAQLLETSENNLMAIACMKRKQNGEYPAWYISSGVRGASLSYVDMDVLDEYSTITKKAWNYATDSLFWIFEDLGYSVHEIAVHLSGKSDSTVTAWEMYIHRDMWVLPKTVVYELKANKLFDFIKHGTRLIYDDLKNNKRGKYER